MSHAETCPVCFGQGTVQAGITHDGTAVRTDKQKTCHGCGGRGWVTVPDSPRHFVRYPPYGKKP